MKFLSILFVLLPLLMGCESEPSFKKAKKSVCDPTCSEGQICRKGRCWTTCEEDSTCAVGEKCSGVTMRHKDGNTSYTEGFSACRPAENKNKKPEEKKKKPLTSAESVAVTAAVSTCKPECGEGKICHNKSCLTKCTDDKNCPKDEFCAGYPVYRRIGNVHAKDAIFACKSRDVLKKK